MTQFASASQISNASISKREAQSLDAQLRAGFNAQELLSEQARRKALKSLRSSLERHQHALMDALRRDLGKPAFEAYTSEIGFCFQDIDHTLSHLSDWMRARDVSVPLALQPASATSYHVPKGVVLIISPWNYPTNLLLAPIVAALAAGCHVVCKPAEDTPHTSHALGELLAEALPPSQCAVVQGPGAEVVPVLMEAIRFDHVFYTGSTSVGRIIGEQCGRELIPCTLELGGKSPAIVLEDADLDVAASRILWGKLMNAGQTCVAPDYVLVHDSVFDELLHKMTKLLNDRYGTDPQQSPDLARIVNERHTKRLATIIEQAEVLHGGNTDLASRYIEPTLVAGDLSADWMQSEIFGPVLPLLKVANWQEVKATIARYPNPLAAYLFSGDKQAQRRFVEELQFGGGCINDTIIHLGIPGLPFGGVQQSGLGRYHADAGFRTFSNQKSIAKNTTLFDAPVRYPPYKDKVLQAVKWLLG